MKFKTTPFPHQLAEFELSREQEARALWWEMGCVDIGTEYLSPVGWRSIADYDGSEVAQWDPVTGRATWAKPTEFINLPCSEFYQFLGRTGINQVLSGEHRMPVMTKRGTAHSRTITAEALVTHLGQGRYVRLPSKFVLDPTGPGILLTDNQLRLQVAVMADGSFPKKAPHTKRCVMRLKKQRKIDRLRMLLGDMEGVYERFQPSTGFMLFSFQAPMRCKTWPQEWWEDVSTHQRNILLSELFLWDGHTPPSNRGPSFYSRHESDVDFVQFLAASAGMVTHKCKQPNCWELAVRGTRTNGFIVTQKNVSSIPSPDGRKYCFVVPSGYWIARRGGKPFPTGNCAKTKPIIDTIAWLYLHGKITGALVLAPKGVAPNWILDEIPIHMPDEVMARTHLLLWEGSRMNTQKYQHELHAALAHDGLLFVVMSYHGIMTGTPGKVFKVKNMKRAFKGCHLAKELLTTRDCLAALDESTEIKNPNSKRTKRVQSMGVYAKYRRVLDGLPVTNSAFDVYSPIRFLDPMLWRSIGCDSFGAFKTQFGVWVERVQDPGACPHVRLEDCNCRKFQMLVEHKNLSDLNKIVLSVGARHLKDDVLDLPPKLFSKRYFDLSPGQRKIYEALERDFMVWLDSGELITAPLVITQLLRLQQITSGYCPTDDGEMYLADDNPRVPLLMETVRQCGGKIMIWGKFRQDITQIMTALKASEISAVRYDGQTSDADREIARNAFQKGDAQVFVGNPACAGRGLTLHAAKTVIYYNTSFKYGDRKQSEDRAHRAGMGKLPVTYIDIIASGTYDEKIVKALRRKQSLSNEIMGDKTQDWI